jgi:hypothetical protein
MKRSLGLLLITAAAPGLSGCIAGMAASAVGMAARGAQGRPVSNEMLQPQAREACSAQAAHYGAVHVIDVEQQSTSKIVVWGTVDDGKQKHSFECAYRTKVTGFKLRPITPAR